MEYGILSLVPPLTAIVLALITKQTIISLFVGVWVGSTLINGWNPLVGFVNSISDYIIPSIANEWNAGLLVLVALAGGFVYMIKASGAAKALEQVASKSVKTRKKALTITWLAAFGFIYTEPTLTLGTIMRPITDSVNVARVKLAYILDAMGGNLASISPISSYGPFITGLIATQLTALGLSDNPWTLFIKMIPYNLYGIFAMLTALFVIRTGLDIGPMYKAEKRAKETGEVIGEDDTPMIREDEEEIISDNENITLKNFVIPLASLIIAIFAVIFWSGDIMNNGFRGAFLNANIVVAISTGFFAGAIGAAIVGMTSGLLNTESSIDKWTDGIMKLMFVPLILVLAWSIGNIASAMDVQGYLVNFIEKFSLTTLVPALVFLVGSIVSFSTGSSWGVFAIMMPIALPIAHNLGLSLPLIIGAVIGSGLFGDHCSPISDTTIMSSTGAACDHIEHVKTQLPYALIVGVSAFIGYLVSGLARMPILSIPVTLVLIVITLYYLHNTTEKLERE